MRELTIVLSVTTNMGGAPDHVLRRFVGLQKWEELKEAMGSQEGLNLCGIAIKDVEKK